MEAERAQPIILDYRKPLPPRRFARFARAGMLALAILAILTAALCLLNPVLELSPILGGGTLGTPFAPIQAPVNHEHAPATYLPEALAYLALFIFMQWCFLSPRGSWRPRLATGLPPSRRAAVAAGFIGMLLCVGLIATLMEIPNLWLRLFAEGDVDTSQHFAPMWIAMVILWAVWACIFHAYWRGLEQYTAMRKVLRWLLAGTILELLVAAPAHAIIVNSRGDDCYCERGTWTGVAFGCTALLWLFGPGAFFLYLRERKRRELLI